MFANIYIIFDITTLAISLTRSGISEKDGNIFEEKKGKGKTRKEKVHICRMKNCYNAGFCVLHAVCTAFYWHK
jgi:hypothetical protein